MNQPYYWRFVGLHSDGSWRPFHVVMTEPEFTDWWPHTFEDIQHVFRCPMEAWSPTKLEATETL